ncbi:DUF551 domain-containing protein [Klebsiella michiganensis]|uniref:DUF551 domain-containing protein n=1 Tax=Klebsiella michiganensis TaxID=1134687 RepID=UPI001D17FAE1|nr:DUF551 domain-containing protein [Klebsiella michiganensis]
MTNNQLAENSVIQLLNSVKLARDNAERADNRVDHSFYYALTIALEELQERRKAAMDSEPVELPLDYMQGHKDGLEWAARLAEANHPETGDWLYDDPIELAKAIRKGPDMPPVQPVADSEPVIVVGDDGGDALSYRRLIQSFEPGTKLYRHAQPVPVVPDELNTRTANDVMNEHLSWKDYGDAEVFCIAWNACRAAMLQELKKSAGTEAICRSDENVQVLHTKSPAQSDCCPAQNVVAPEQNGDTPAQSQGWIPVSERMPGNGVQVLVSDVSGHVFVCHHDGSFWVDFRVGIGKRRITHWMPLPAAPQEVK